MDGKSPESQETTNPGIFDTNLDLNRLAKIKDSKPDEWKKTLIELCRNHPPPLRLQSNPEYEGNELDDDKHIFLFRDKLHRPYAVTYRQYYSSKYQILIDDVKIIEESALDKLRKETEENQVKPAEKRYGEITKLISEGEKLIEVARPKLEQLLQTLNTQGLDPKTDTVWQSELCNSEAMETLYSACESFGVSNLEDDTKEEVCKMVAQDKVVEIPQDYNTFNQETTLQPIKLYPLKAEYSFYLIVEYTISTEVFSDNERIRTYLEICLKGNQLKNYYEAKDSLEKAIAEIKQTLALIQSLSSPDHPND